LFLAFWGSVYLESWNRKQAELNIFWHLEDFQEREIVRPSFMGEHRHGVYIKGHSLALEPGPNFSPPVSLWTPPHHRYWKFGAGLSMLITFLFLGMVATFGIFIFRAFITRITQTMGGVVAGCINSTIIIILNMVYRKVAVYLTDWENYRTESEYENSFVVKNYMFQFVNSYISLFYIAFMKGRVSVFGLTETCSPNCMTELTIQLGALLLSNIFIGQLFEVGIPWLTAKFSLLWEGHELKKKGLAKEADAADDESKLTAYTSTFDDYNEMAIQFGYVTLFAAAFPAASLAAVLNNIVEMRSDCLKLLTGMQRPNPRSANSIGSWFEILKVVSYLSVMTNVALFLFTATAIDWGISNLEKLWVAIVIEHMVFVIKWVLEKIIPDVPTWVREEQVRREYFKFKADGKETMFHPTDDPTALTLLAPSTSTYETTVHEKESLLF